MELQCLTLKDLTSPRKSLGLREVEKDEEQKENLCLEQRWSTPLKSNTSHQKGASPDLAQVTPKPWTPTANLKMLISAASPDIRDREMKKVLFRALENDKELPNSPRQVVGESTENWPQLGEMEEDMEKKPSRKQKSLGLLCQKFLALYPENPPPDSPIWISLDKVASTLGVERRRIYDIVNVLESLMIVGRMAKNSYTWHGRRRLEAMLKHLQSRGRQDGLHLHMKPGAKGNCAANGETGDSGANEDEEPEGEGAGAGGNRKDKSLRIMSQKFVTLFLVSNTQTVTLDTAAKILIEDSQDSTSHSQYKTKVRRLYDIANVLTSLGLIQKVHVREKGGRKPAFKWLGPTEFNCTGTSPPSGQRVKQQDLNRLKLSRHSSFSIISPTSVTSVQRPVSSAPCSPHREHTAATQAQPVDYSRKTSICHFTNSDSPQPALTSTSPPLPPRESPTSGLPQCVAFLPSLSQPSVVTLYRTSDHGLPQGPEEEEKRRRKREHEEEGEEPHVKKEKELQTEYKKRTRECSQSPSHYLYVPNNPGLNFLFSSASSSSVPTLAVPCVLLPPSTVSLSIGLSSGVDSQPTLSFGFPPAMASPGGEFQVGSAGALQSPSTPEQPWLFSSSTPSITARAQEPMTPCTPKENSALKSFFQTPATPVNAHITTHTTRRRGSAQRRLDLPPNKEKL